MPTSFKSYSYSPQDPKTLDILSYDQREDQDKIKEGPHLTSNHINAPTHLVQMIIYPKLCSNDNLPQELALRHINLQTRKIGVKGWRSSRGMTLPIDMKTLRFTILSGHLLKKDEALLWLHIFMSFFWDLLDEKK